MSNRKKKVCALDEFKEHLKELQMSGFSSEDEAVYHCLLKMGEFWGKDRAAWGRCLMVYGSKLAYKDG